ncbi:PepSY domain-containing protein [Sphingomonas parva]|uniref:PepSY domain-containing protein n=1 Tax=Sphingomonas parva TaxID=2555898 RepID=A0A4Y8ZXN3_9SPHN|nr:PepSY-associated TM helix domain-containing protein [Sphingomonas parva]TFI60327.1 PepSY domain-containing protein [Sphingomonas parva]
MAGQTTLRLRKIWFQVHKWIGIALAVLIIPISLTGSALVWHDALDGALNPERRATSPATLPASAYEAAARKALAPGETLASIAFPDGKGAVVATATRAPAPGGGRPVRTQIYLDPASGAVVDRASSNEGLVHVFHVLHGSLMVPGVGRQIVGWIGVFMLLSSLTGLWLWWPVTGSVSRGFRWKRQPTTSANLHHLTGFWIAIPLAMLSFTGAWISFPAFFAQISGDPAGPSPAERMRRMAAVPAAETRIDVDVARVLAERFANGPLATITWPAGKEPKWKVAFRGPGGIAEVSVDDATGKASPPKPPQPETTARLMRRLHDGTGMGAIWQAIIFAGGIIPALLAVTGIMMWLRTRRWRGEVARRQAANRAVPAE